MIAMTPLNIAAGFQASGIHPFNRDIFSEIDFSPSLPTDREQNVAAESLGANSTVEDAGPSGEVPGAVSPVLNDDVQLQTSKQMILCNH